MRREILAALLLSTSTAALAQSSTAPAQMGITPATVPEVLQVLDNTKTWVNIGTVDSAKHIFAPVGGAYLNVLNYGFAIGGADNVPAIPTLMAGIGPSPGFGYSGGYQVEFPPVAGQEYTDYYFSQPLVISRGGSFHCGGHATDGGDASMRLIFAPGVDGVVFESGAVSADGGWAAGDMTGCGVVSLGSGSGTITAGSTSITGAAMVSVNDPGIPSSVWGVGDGIIAIAKFNPYNSSPAVPPGAFISAVAGTTLTLSSPANANIGGLAGAAALYQLPASQKFTVQTTAGSNSVTVTAGPRPMKPGDVVWSDAFPFGTSVLHVSGITLPQTVTMDNVFLSAAANATVTHAPGQMWTIPAGYTRRVQSAGYNLFISGFPIGLHMVCHAGTVPTTGCNDSYDRGSAITQALVGRWVVGDNTGASVSVGDIFGKNYIADVAEMGTIGSTYVGLNSNSSESGSALYGAVGNCGSENYSSYVGGYIGNGNSYHYCMDPAAGIGAPTLAGQVGPVFIAPQGGAPLDASIWEQQDIKNTMKFYPAVYPGYGQICAGFNIGNAIFGFSLNNCDSNTLWGLSWNATANSWDMAYWGSGLVMRYTAPPTGGWGNYTGYDGHIPLVDFPPGILISNFEHGDSVGTERLLCMSATMPTGTAHKRGDLCFNTAAAHGSPMGWVDLSDGANFVPLANVP